MSFLRGRLKSNGNSSTSPDEVDGYNCKAKVWAGYEEDVERGAHLIEPEFDLTSFNGVLLAGDFNAGLDLADGHAGQIELSIVNTLDQSTTPPWGRGLRSSDTTLMSSQ